MNTSAASQPDAYVTRVVNRAGLDDILARLRDVGYRLVGPRVRDQAIVYDEIASTADLPVGVADEQDAGRYRLRARQDQALFGYVIGPHSWKKFLNPPVQKMYSVTRQGRALDFAAVAEPPSKTALIGVRGCELAAIAVQDRVYIGGPLSDGGYRRRREHVFIVAVNCTQPASTCFCVSMQTGPRAGPGYDLAVTELLEDGRQEYLVTPGSARGAEVLGSVSSREADGGRRRAEEAALFASAAAMRRSLDTRGIKELLYRSYDDPHWDDVARRCLACGNCTLACPTCFCSTVEDVTDLSGSLAERTRKWDSCFNADFSYLHGGSVRSSIRSRYRQWMVHKLASWHDQFGTSGCVGCGRCITWCPVGIDITHEVATLRSEEARRTTAAAERPPTTPAGGRL